MWVRESWHQLILSKTLNHCFVLRRGCKVFGPVCCSTHVKEPVSALIHKEKGFGPVFLVWSEAKCATTPCYKMIRSHNSNVVSHLAGNNVLQRQKRHWVTDKCAIYKKPLLLLCLWFVGHGKVCKILVLYPLLKVFVHKNYTQPLTHLCALHFKIWEFRERLILIPEKCTPVSEGIFRV